jgi:hypothetical protein
MWGRRSFVTLVLVPYQRQDAVALGGMLRGLTFPMSLVVSGERTALYQHLGRSLEITDLTAVLPHGHPHELRGAVERLARQPWVAWRNLSRIGALARGVLQQSHFERITGTGRDLGVVSQNHGVQSALLVRRVDATHMRAIFGQRAVLVGGDDGNSAECLHGAEPANNGVAPGQSVYTHGQRKRQNRWPALRHGGHGQGWQDRR